MLLSRSRGLIGLLRKRGTRQFSWIKPKFEGGNAKPHEIGKFLRQNLFTYGEPIVFGTLFFFVPFILYFRMTSREALEQMARVDYAKRTIYHYPYPTREEDS